MSASSCATLPAVLDALRAALVAEGDLSGVGIYSGFPGLPLPDEYIFFGNEVTFDEDEPLGMGGTPRTETYTIGGSVSAQKPVTAGWEAGIKAARDRAFALYAELEAYLNENYTIGGTCRTADIGVVGVVQGIGEVGSGPGYICDIDFSIVVEANKTPAR